MSPPSPPAYRPSSLQLLLPSMTSWTWSSGATPCKEARGGRGRRKSRDFVCVLRCHLFLLVTRFRLGCQNFIRPGPFHSRAARVPVVGGKVAPEGPFSPARPVRTVLHGLHGWSERMSSNAARPLGTVAAAAAQCDSGVGLCRFSMVASQYDRRAMQLCMFG